MSTWEQKTQQRVIESDRNDIRVNEYNLVFHLFIVLAL